ncbi:MAG: carbamoyltransferase [Luminiphilus sp.]|nr:carbamoyltransferase [Luminiphilus sp.]MDG1507876.1 carbamoyltransferase [Luminiphilus sp.]
MTQSINVLGLSAFYHDSAAALLVDGKIVAAAQEERFSRKKHDAAFPANAIAYCLEEAGLSLAEIDYITFYDKPLVKFERLLETYLAFAPKGFRSFVMAIPVWLKEKLFLKVTLKRELASLSGLEQTGLPPLLFHEHHGSHAASAFYASPFKTAAVLCLDGVGEWATSSVWLGDGSTLTPQWEIQFPHSLGLLYSAFTYYSGFKVNSGEYKLMGLAPYGEPRYVDLIKAHLMDIKPDGTFRLDMRYFNYATGLTMTNRRFDRLFGGPPRQPEAELTQREMDIAASIQAVTEDIVLKLAATIHRELEVDHLCLAGGVALNCVANGRLEREGPFEQIWIQPAAGDAGGALGAALATWHEYLDKPREANDRSDTMQGAYLGKSFSQDAIDDYLTGIEAPFHRYDDTTLMPEVAAALDCGAVVGWFNGRMEFGPRALGARSIIGDARSPTMQSVMNLKIKNRESFRPFAPAIKASAVSDWFNTDTTSPYMLKVATIREDRRLPMSDEDKGLFGIDQLNVARSQVPAITHVDYSARLQTVHEETNPRFHSLLSAFEAITGCPVLINTSFNVRGEPIVCSPEDAYRCFMRTEMDLLVLGNALLIKAEQPEWDDDESWKEEFQLD